ncbi:hypothetical protein [Caldimonas brevitalea]|uniref:Uncharacterized protein n=1 Tax=Caldimonas brevitalea TaxID=413882 RepID=A0A0G3BYY1_9BURK|nr:hypothetical protein [Caldimonas brevitalea]AKJ31735.1 hypothetical protein AAW51_5044 [Caldimonas brevitalea]
MAHTQHNHPRTPSAGSGSNEKNAGPPVESQNDPQRGQGTKVTQSPRKHAPQAAAGKRHE